mgnify:CR=1 FL=1
MVRIWSTVMAAAGLSVQAAAAAGSWPIAQAPPAAESAAPPGPHAAGWRVVTVTRPAGGDFTALLTYPATRAERDAPLDDRGAPYPVVAFGHGFLQAPERYQGTLLHLASWGFLVIAPQSHAGLSPDHAAFAADLNAAVDGLARESAAAGSWLFGRVDDAYGLAGHSMGGGASLAAAAANPRIDAVLTLAAADTRPSTLPALPRIAAPLAFLVGSDDAIVPAASTAPLYGAGRAPKQLVTLAGGSHCGFQDEPFPIACDRGTLARDDQLALTRQRLADFFRLYLTGDASRYDAVWAAPDDPRVTLVADPGRAGPPAALYLPRALRGP